jgi:chorismate synthase
MGTIAYRQVTALEQLEQLVELQKIVWGMTERDCVPSHLFHSVTHGGGVVIGAYLEDTIVGFTWGFPARPEEALLWSDMAGVLPQYQGRGIGFGLKQTQRQWAIERGFKRIGWTYDPMQRGNANFNLHRLGAMSKIYLVNFYGELGDEINAGLPSDRLEISWDLHSPRVNASAQGQCVPLLTSCPAEQFLLRADENGKPVVTEPLALTANWHFVEIPYNINNVKQENIENAKAWQAAVRQVLQLAFEQGYAAVDFSVCQDCSWYVLKKEETGLAVDSLLARP